MRTDMIKSSVYGAFGGAVALAVVGFGWGGWVTAGSAELMARCSTCTDLRNPVPASS